MIEELSGSVWNEIEEDVTTIGPAFTIWDLLAKGVQASNVSKSEKHTFTIRNKIQELVMYKLEEYFSGKYQNKTSAGEGYLMVISK